MKLNSIKRKKLIAKVYSESDQDKFNRRYLLVLLGLACGLVLSMQTLPSHAASPRAANSSITLELNNGQINVDYSQVDQFNEKQDAKAVKFAALDDKQLILSDKPIKIDNVKRGYQSRSLADLGVRINIDNELLGDTVVRIPTYNLVRNEIQTAPVIPEMIVVSDAAPVQTAEVVTQPTAAPVASTPASTTMVAATPAASIGTSKLSNSDILFWKIFGVSALFVSLLLVLLRVRSIRDETNSNIYTGQPHVNEAMVGKGKLFDFNGNVMKGRVTPINTTFLNMLWHVGKFSKEGSMNTYFYMAFYIPPQQDYAKSLQKQNANKTKETHTEV